MNQNASPGENNLGLWGFIVALLGWLTCGLLAPVGLIMSLVALKREPRGFAIAGVVLGALGSCGIIIGLVFFVGALAMVLAGLGFAGLAVALGGPDFEAQHDMAQIDAALYEAQQSGGTVPDGLDTLTLDSATLVDPWGNPYVYTLNDDGTWGLSSKGEDGQAGTADDVVFGDGRINIDLRR